RLSFLSHTTAPTHTSPLSLHDALPISAGEPGQRDRQHYRPGPEAPAEHAGVVVDRGAAMEARHGRESKERLVEQRVTEETRLLAHDGDEPWGDDQHGGRHRGGDGSGGS